MKSYQTIFMILLTLAVGMLFLFGTPPTDLEKKYAALETTNAQLQSTITYWERQPTEIPVSPTPFPTETPVNLAAGNPNAPVATFPMFPTALGTTAPVVQTLGARIVNVQATTQVDAQGCAMNPSNSFTPNDTIYGVVTLADMEVGNQLAVQFYYDTGESLVYEDNFTIQAGGSYCRWYIIEPDNLGWEAGTYTISYSLDNAPASEMTYNISGLSDTMSEEEPTPAQ